MGVTTHPGCESSSPHPAAEREAHERGEGEYLGLRPVQPRRLSGPGTRGLRPTQPQAAHGRAPGKL